MSAVQLNNWNGGDIGRCIDKQNVKRIENSDRFWAGFSVKECNNRCDGRATALGLDARGSDVAKTDGNLKYSI